MKTYPIMKKQSTWFSHDATASQDPKLIALIAACGMQGYGRWWRLVEILRGENRYRYDITTRFAYTVLARELMCATEEARQFITDCIEEYELLKTDHTHTWSPSLCDRMEHLDRQKAILSERGRKGGLARRTTQVNKSESTSTAQAGTGEANKTKQKESKQNETKPLLFLGGDISPAGEMGEVTWEKHKTAALADPNFLYPIISSGKVTEARLARWLTTFNRILAFRGEAPKKSKKYGY